MEQQWGFQHGKQLEYQCYVLNLLDTLGHQDGVEMFLQSFLTTLPEAYNSSLGEVSFHLPGVHRFVFKL